MTGLLIPDDWDEQADGYCSLSCQVPNNPVWRANVKGALFYLTKPSTWDAETGDTEQAAQVGMDIFKSAAFDCPQPPTDVDFCIAYGTFVSSTQNSITVRAASAGSGWYWKVFVNQECGQPFGPEYYLWTTTSPDYVPTGTKAHWIFQTDQVVVDDSDTLLTNYCGQPVDGKGLDAWSEAGQFEITLTLGVEC